jgi:hypothetical protein
VLVHQIGEVRDQLLVAECIDFVGEVLADAPHAARVGLDRLGLQALELQVLQVRLVLPLEMLREVRHDEMSSLGGCRSRPQNRAREVPPYEITSRDDPRDLLRVAASSNTSNTSLKRRRAPAGSVSLVRGL